VVPSVGSLAQHGLQQVKSAGELCIKKTVKQRLAFYARLYKSDPNSMAAPYANMQGILRNVLGYTKQEAKKYARKKP